LPRDGLRGLEVGLEHRVVERTHADEAAGVDVDRGQRLGLVEDQVAPALQVDAAVQRALDFLLDGIRWLVATSGLDTRFVDALPTALVKPFSGSAARAMLIETEFAEETETDLFGEQAVLCGGATELVLKGYETLVEAGYQPEVAYYECLHELKLIVDLLHEGGLAKMHQFISDTAKYGDLTRGPRIVNKTTKKEMKKVLKEIQDGKFARQWMKEAKGGMKKYKKLMNQDLKHPIEKVGVKLRARMPWLNG